MPAFAVLRFAKITSLAGLSGAAAHNMRTAGEGLEHADDHAPQMGGGVCLLAGSTDAVAAWRARCEQLGIDQARIRKDAVRAIELVASVSPAWFLSATDDERAAWRDKSLAWAIDLIGAENLLQATLHDDEDTPHLHVLAIPAVQKPRKAAGRPRKGRPPQQRAIASWGLSASDLLGGREQLTAHQTAYAASLADLGIRRGVPRRVTGARHKSAHAYRAEAASDRAEAAGLHETVVSLLTTAERQASAFTTGLDAIEVGELVHRPAHEGRLQGLERKAVEAPVLPTDREGLRGWKEAVAPFWSRLVAYARRLAILRVREATLDRVADRQAVLEREGGTMDGPAVHDALSIARSRTNTRDRLHER